MPNATTRRQFLATAGAAALAPLVPLGAVAEATVMPAAAPKMMAFAVGIEDRMHDVFWAPTKQDAVDQYISGHLDGYCGDDGKRCEDEDCEFCLEVESVDVYRAPKLDNVTLKAGQRLSNAQYFKGAGFSARCNTCEDAGQYSYWDDHCDDSAYVIDNRVICTDCMNHEPRDVMRRADPERYAEWLDEILSREYGEAVR